MHLIIFDIDGTLVDSVDIDNACFIQTFKDLYQIELNNTDWNIYEHVTDRGLTDDILLKHLGRKPTEIEVTDVKEYFYQLLYARRSELKEIPGANHALKILSDLPHIAIALATGGWAETALLKLRAIKANSDSLIMTTSDDHYSRRSIIELAIYRSLEKNKISSFQSISYIGDGLWDFRVCTELGINFIGIDFDGDNKLREVGVSNLMTDLSDIESILGFAFE